MSHTGGIIRGSDMTPGSRYEVISLRDSEASCAPGTHFHYSNVGYQALGYLRVSGRPAWSPSVSLSTRSSTGGPTARACPANPYYRFFTP